jgi:hypothetical protein
MVPGIKSGRPDTATIPSGRTVNFEGPGRSGATAMELTSLTVSGTLRGVSSAVPINIRTTGDITVMTGGHVGGSAANVSKNNINLEAGGAISVNGTVEGQRGAVTLKATGNITVGGSGRVLSRERSVGIVSRSGAVTVAAGGSVIAKQSVGIQAGPHQPVQVDGLVRSENGSVVINGGLTQSQAGNVTVGVGGRIEAPNGEVIITADTLRVAGTIKGHTVQKKCKVVILEPGGSIEGKGSEKDKIAAKEKVEPREDAAVPAQKAQAARVIGGENAVIDYSGVLGTAIEAETSVRVATGPLGTLDLRGNPPGTPVISCPGPIELFADQILLDPGVQPTDLCGPGPVLMAPGQPLLDAGCLAAADSVGYPGLPGRASFIVSNLGNIGGPFELSVIDLSGWGHGPLPPVLWLNGSGDDVDTLITVTVDIPPWAVPDIDTLRLRLRVATPGDPFEPYEEELKLPVRAFDELKDVDVSNWGVDSAPAGDTTLVHLWVANNGVLPDDYHLTAWDRDGWGVLPHDPLVVLPPAIDTIRSLGLIVPPGLPAGHSNELYVRVESLGSPMVAATDTIELVVGTVSAVPLAIDGNISHRCWPNPFNPVVNIGFRLVAPADVVTVTVYDLEGRRVRVLPPVRLTGLEGRVSWDGRDDLGGATASGVYVYRIRSGDRTATGKMILAR